MQVLKSFTLIFRHNLFLPVKLRLLPAARKKKL